MAKVSIYFIVEPEEIHNQYYGVEEENDDDFMNEWEQNARDARLDKLQSQMKNQKQMLTGVQSMLPKGMPQLMKYDTPVENTRRSQLKLGNGIAHNSGYSKTLANSNTGSRY